MLNSTLRSKLGALALLVAVSGALALSPDASAQARRWRPAPKRVVVWHPDRNLRTIIDRTERESNALRNSFERDYNKYRLNRLPAGERAKENVQEMDQAFERLRGFADDANPARAREQMRAVVRQSNDVDTIFGNHPEITAFVRGQWRNLREDINRLAHIYGIDGLGKTGSPRRR